MQPQTTDITPDENDEQAHIADTLQALGGRLSALAEEQVRNRQRLEQRWLADLRQVHGKITADEEERLRKANKSKLVVNISRNKSNAAEARLADLAAPTDTRHWGIQPTPVPEIEAGLTSENIVQGPDGQPVKERDLAKQEMEIARDRAERMEKAINDQLTEANFNPKLRTMIHDQVRLGTGVLKGPIVVGRSRRAWEEVEPQSGVYSLAVAEDLRPGVEVVNPWNFFPDMRSCSIEEAEFVFERKFLTKKMLRNLAEMPESSGYMVDQIKELLLEEPKTLAISDAHIDEMREISGVDPITDSNRYELWEYHGPIDKDDLIACGCEIDDEDPLEEYEGVVELCGTRVIRALIQTIETGDLIYSVANWENDNSSIFGYGVPYLMRNSQKVITSAWRMLMDNAGLCVGGQLVIDRGKIKPADGKWELSPRKVWWYDDVDGGRVHDAFAVHEISSHQAELAAIFTMARQLADEETNLPLIAQGEQTENITQTARGMSILMASADVVLRRSVKALDDHIYKTLIGRFYDWNMQYNPDPEIKGDFEIDARGSDAMMEDAAQEQGLLETAQLVNDPTYGPMMKSRAMLVRIVKSKKIDPDEVVKSEEEIKEMAQQQGPQIDPIEQAKLQLQQQTAQMQQQAQQVELQLKQKELEGKQQDAAMDNQVALAKMELERELGFAKLALEKEVTLGKLYQQLGLEKEKLQTTRQVEGVKAMTKQDEMALKQRMGSGI